MFRIFVLFLLLRAVNLSPLHDERRQIITRVKNYLQQYDTTTRSVENPNWLKGSSKVGFGYNLLAASPICFTGSCQTDEFTRAIFKLNYSSSITGSCTDKLVPNNVELDCLPPDTRNIDSEIIETVEHLETFTTKKVEFPIGAQFKANSFSYKHSKETQRMIDNIVKNNQVSILTSVEISYAKLSMFEPKMKLSDNFRYVIENMFCCEEDDPDIEQYVQDYIIDYFGVAYLTSIVLGGVVKQNILISRAAKERLEKNNVSVLHVAAITFDNSMGSNISSSVGTNTAITLVEVQTHYGMFTKENKLLYNSTIGGKSDLKKLDEWSKTVPSNPVIIKRKVRDIFRLFTKYYFPNDPLISNKSKLIEKIFQKYRHDSVYCYKNCGGNAIQGICKPTGFFQFGICKCNLGWTGSDCETSTVHDITVLQGTICGFDRSFMHISCNGTRPWKECPYGWISRSWSVDLTICYKNQTAIEPPMYGTICGIHSYHSSYNFNIAIKCHNSSDRLIDTCPENYRSFHEKQGNYVASNSVCAALNPKVNLPGTICGMQIEESRDGPTCNGFHPGLRLCLPNYAIRRIAFEAFGFMVCVKT
ncbi:unnamed protein product [Rotaria magnacalcarata]|uniref:Uncharacterized protein n=2 Tax=Rotaria magnacalcarata TaxID=392030 RepID=A0A815PK92_9BILA|nr:unnamed protein product [Rotaria magnacalcarata]